MVVLGVRTDPKPLHTNLDRQPECAIAKPNANAVESPAAYLLEIQRRVSGVTAKQFIVAACQFLYLRREPMKAIPEAPGCQVLQISVARPAK